MEEEEEGRGGENGCRVKKNERQIKAGEMEAKEQQERKKQGSEQIARP